MSTEKLNRKLPVLLQKRTQGTVEAIKLAIFARLLSFRVSRFFRGWRVLRDIACNDRSGIQELDSRSVKWKQNLIL